MANPQLEDGKTKLALIENLMAGGLDADDSDYLIFCFTSQGLRRELVAAQMQASVAAALGEDFPAAFWNEMARAFQNAYDVRVWLETATRPKTHLGRRVDPQVIKEKVDIVSLVERYTTLRKAGKNFIGCCPLHNDTHPSFTVYPEQQSWHCFGCGRGGDVFSLIMEIEHVDFLGAVAILGSSHG